MLYKAFRVVHPERCRTESGQKKKIKKLCGAIVSADRHPINGLKK